MTHLITKDQGAIETIYDSGW